MRRASYLQRNGLLRLFLPGHDPRELPPRSPHPYRLACDFSSPVPLRNLIRVVEG